MRTRMIGPVIPVLLLTLVLLSPGCERLLPGTIGILSPGDGDVFPVGTAVKFKGYAKDEAGNSLSEKALAWWSSLDGKIGAGKSFSKSTLSIGKHDIDLLAVSPDGSKQKASVSIEIGTEGGGSGVTGKLGCTWRIICPDGTHIDRGEARIPFVIKGDRIVATGTDTVDYAATWHQGTCYFKHTGTVTAKDPEGKIIEVKGERYLDLRVVTFLWDEEMTSNCHPGEDGDPVTSPMKGTKIPFRDGGTASVDWGTGVGTGIFTIYLD
ncbi:MAG: hypothetical protein HQ559_13940 [Lentisphaerae bacterium]|nr:hypothetical protein [Lentisphaerota bacterium]